MNCWEYNKCGREKGGAKAQSLGVCSAWPDNGQNCALVAGTMSQNSDPRRVCHHASCWLCDFHRQAHHFKSQSGAVN